MKVLGTTLEEIPWAISIILYKVRKVMLARGPILEMDESTYYASIY